MRGIWSKFSDDEGMTIIEVMIAAAILLIVMTALLGLMTQTLYAGVQSKEKALFTNAVNSYIEQVQALDFKAVGIVGTGEGKLASVESIDVEGYTVTFKPTVTLGEVSTLKKLTVQATMSAAGRTVRTMSTDVLIRDKTSIAGGESTGEPSEDPTEDPVENPVGGITLNWITTNMPSQNEVVYDNLKSSGGLLKLEAEASAPDGRTITRVTIRADDGSLLKRMGATDPVEASWTFPIETAQQTWKLTGFNWNTRQTTLVDGVSQEVITDGLRTITIRVEDSGSSFTERTYVLLVDNEAPPAPKDLKHIITAGAGSAATWTTPFDGDTMPPFSTVVLRRQVASAWSEAETTGITSNQIALEPFSRYIVSVKSVGVPPKSRSSAVTKMSRSVFTPPNATGSYTTSGAWTTLSLSVGEPTFAVSGTTKYQWYKSTALTGPWTAQGATAVSTARQWDDKYKPKDRQTEYYRCMVTFTPAETGEPDGSQSGTMTIFSAVVGPTSAAGTSGSLGTTWLP